MYVRRKVGRQKVLGEGVSALRMCYVTMVVE